MKPNISPEKQQAVDKIKTDIEVFLARGGGIRMVDHGETGVKGPTPQMKLMIERTKKRNRARAKK